MERAIQEHGFTLIELIVTMVIIGILAGIVIFSPKTFLVTARDQERADDTGSIARRLEEAYTSKDLNYPAYPSTTELATDMQNHTRTVTRLQPEAFQAPNGEAISVVAAQPSDTPGGSTPSAIQYIYQPLTSSGALCTANPSNGSCVRFYLYYRLEKDGSTKIIKSLHQQ